MRRVGGSLPVAPQVANAPGREQAHRTLYDDELLRTALGDRVGKCTPEGEDVKLMGRYLFDALIGHNAWEAVCEAARTAGDPLVELALTWAAADAELNLLKWEMMHDGTEFLAASRRCAVAITRVVRDAPEPEHPLESLTAPVRVLFVIGLGLADPDIRAGAEIMGLLRSVEQGKGAIVPYVLEQASIRALSREVQRFRPDVVHFIAHGRVSAQGGELLLRDDDDVSRAAPASAGRLLDALRCDEDTRLPHLVVVTVCDSASAYGDTVPLASELVKGGIPIVVGMTGVVSDPVCRLFSNRFGAALTDSVQLVQALTDGRRAALWHTSGFNGSGPEMRLDWALPALFLAPSVPSDHVVVRLSGTTRVFERINDFGLQQKPIFCGRLEFMRLLDRLLDSTDQLNVLVASVERPSEGLVGETRLLHELAHRALRSGHVVIMISGSGSGTRSEPPTTPGQLATLLLLELFETRRRFGLALPGDPAILGALTRAAADGVAVLDLSKTAEEERMVTLTQYCEGWTGQLGARALREALAIDLRRLTEEARASGDPSISDDCRVIVLLEGIQRWADTTDALANTLLTPTGLGVGDHRVPVVLSCNVADVHSDTLRDLQERASGEAWIHFEPLTRFVDPEDTLAYQWMLLNPHPELNPPISEKVYVRSRPDDEDWVAPFRDNVHGLPSRFGHVFYAVASALSYDNHTLIAEDNDEVKLAAYLEACQLGDGG